MNTSILTITTLVVLLAFVAAFTIAIPALEAQARGSPEKAQVILSTEPKERGAVASSGHVGGCGISCG